MQGGLTGGCAWNGRFHGGGLCGEVALRRGTGFVEPACQHPTLEGSSRKGASSPDGHVEGYPSHLLRLRDDRLLLSNGHRTKPLGNQARIRSDHGRTRSAAIVLSDDGTSTDLGYPSTVELDEPGRFLTVWYELLDKSGGGSAAL